MANKFRGEAALEFTREDDSGNEVPAKFKLVFDANAFCEIEELNEGMGMAEVLEVLSDAKKLSFTKLRTIVLGGLLRNHPDLKLADAGDIISDAGMEVVIAALHQAVGGAMPKAKGGAKGETQPPKVIRGAGKKR